MIATLAETEASVRLRFSVQDTGIGIAADQLGLIFEAFTQVDTTSTRRHGGTGLGLAIVRQLVELMQGRLGVDSQPGQGSTFWFELDLRKAAPPAGALATAPPPEAAAGSLAAHVLLVEDDPVNQLVLQSMLTQLGCEVDLASDGAAALGVSELTRFDLVLMDLHMPVMDGYEATRRIRGRERERGGHLPIVALTADALSGDRERCLDAGMDDVVTKPVSTAMLAAVVERWTGRRTPHPSTW